MTKLDLQPIHGEAPVMPQRGFSIRLFWIGLLLVAGFAFFEKTHAANEIGFLIVARDRGASGNREVAELLANVETEYPTALLHIGERDQGVENGYRGEIAQARRRLVEAGVNQVVAIPLFVFEDHPLLTRFRPQIEQAFAPLSLKWAAPLTESYLFEEILLDRFHEAGVEGKAKRWILFSGAPDLETARRWAGRLTEIGKRLARMANWPQPPRIEVLLECQHCEHNEAVFARLRRAEGVLVPAVIERKWDQHMSFMHWLHRRLQTTTLAVTEPLIPHPLVRTHVKREINRAIPVNPAKVGIIVMPHGSTKPYNDTVRATLAPVLAGRPHAYAFGMADPENIALAATELEAKGVRKAVFLRLYAYPWTFRHRTDFILGLERDIPTRWGDVPQRLRSAIIFASVGGYESDPRIASILADRIREISRDPNREAVILLSHGSASDARDRQQLEIVQGHIQRMRDLFPQPFAEIRAMSLREDWPKARAKAISEITAFIQRQHSAGHKVLIVSDRLLGEGPYRHYLAGLEFRLNGMGLLPHPLFQDIVADLIAQKVAELVQTADKYPNPTY